MQPRDPGVATKVVATLAAVGVVVTLAFLPLVRKDVDRSATELCVVIVIASLAVSLVVGSNWIVHATARALAEQLMWAMGPFLAIGLIVTLDLATFDASLAAQIFFLFPALYGGTLLPRPGAIAVTVAALVAEGVVVFANLSPRAAAVDAGYMGAALVTTTVVLVQSTQREAKLRDELHRRANTDSLTGLVNRRAFDAAVAAAIARPTGAGAALVLLDIDLFKSLNDRYGHPGGDAVLVQMSQLLVALARPQDIVCRLGGDEIAVLMSGCSIEIARRRAQEMLETVRAHGFAAGIHTVDDVTISAGLAHYPTDATEFNQLYKAADEALYRAKRDGRNRLAIHSS